jgi:hypothetical protein
MVRRFRLNNGEDCVVFDMHPAPADLADPDLMHGWLCFQRNDERRRFAPIPVDWEKFDDRDLSRMWAHARPVDLKSLANERS